MKKLDELMNELRQSDPFTPAEDDMFNVVDLRGSVRGLAAQIEDLEVKPDPFDQTDSMNQTMRTKNGLRSFLTNISDDVIAEAARKPGAPAQLRAELADIRQNEIALAFKKAVGGRYVATDDNMALVVGTLAEKALGYSNADVETLVSKLDDAGYWTVENLVSVFEELWNDGLLVDYPDGYYTPWTAADLEVISRLAQAGQEVEALTYALRVALDLTSTHPLVIDSIGLDPKHRDLMRQITRFIWGARTPEFSATESDAFDSYLDGYVGNRPFTLPLIDAAWRAYQAGQKTVLRNRALGIDETKEPDFSPEGFDTLSDEEIARLKDATFKFRAKGR
jgi:hypothetical protein